MEAHFPLQVSAPRCETRRRLPLRTDRSLSQQAYVVLALARASLLRHALEDCPQSWPIVSSLLVRQKARRPRDLDPMREARWVLREAPDGTSRTASCYPKAIRSLRQAVERSLDSEFWGLWVAIQTRIASP